MEKRKRRRKCYLCPNVDETLRTFPANSRETVQKQWIGRLGLSEEETSDMHALYRQKIAQGTDIRWCSKHFSITGELPTDLRPIPLLQTRELRPELQPQRLQQRYRNATSCSTPVVSDVEMDETGLATPPLLSPRRLSSPLHLDRPFPLDDYDDFYNDDMISLPKRFRTQSTIRSEITVDKGSIYHPSSQEMGNVSESDYEEEDEESEEVGEIKYRMVEEKQLRSLFRRCQECGQLLDSSLVNMRAEGSACIVDYDCLACNATVNWRSQERVGKGRSTAFKGNQEIAIAAFITGVPLPRLVDFAKQLGIAIPSERVMRRIIREIGCPAIQRVFLEWQNHVRSLAKDASEPDGITVSLDGQYDHPGYNGSNCKVAIFDANLKVILGAACVNKKEKEIEGKSIRMESVGALRAMRELVADGFKIKVRVSDRNAMMDKKLREHPDTASIEARNDWWHVLKPLKKQWILGMKTYPILAQLYVPFVNHLYYCHQKYAEKEDRAEGLELAQSYLMHIIGKCSWKKGGKFTRIMKCDHGKLKRRKPGEPKRLRIKVDSEEYKLVEEMLYKKSFEKGFLSSTPLFDTAINECFHSVSLIYSSKRCAW